MLKTTGSCRGEGDLDEFVSALAVLKSVREHAQREREEQAIESLSDLLGGVEPPAVVPAREKVVAAAGDGDTEVEEEDEGDGE